MRMKLLFWKTVPSRRGALHESLLAQKGLYYETWQAQYGALGTDGHERKEA